MRPEVSICVQTYRHGAYIRQCLDGILKQEARFAYEILLGEDCSNDGTREICQEYALRHPERIRLFLHDRKDNISIEGKPSGRYNIINNLKHVRGRFFAVCDGDDYWTDKKKLHKQHEFLEKNPGYAMSFHAVSVLRDSCFTDSFIPQDLAGSSTINDLARRNYLYTCSVMYRNRLPQNLPQYFFHAPVLDYVLHLYMAQYGKIGYLSDNMAVYREHSGGRWSALRRAEQLESRIRLVSLLAEYFLMPGTPEQFEKQKLECLAELADIYQRAGEGEKLQDCMKIFAGANPAVILDLLQEFRDQSRKLEKILARLDSHPVAGGVIRLLAIMKGDDEFGKI